jgi:hypothetical protein
VCNRNQDNKHDFLVAEFPGLPSPSVAGLQFMPGDGEFVPDKAAGNEFTSTGYGGLEWQFRNEGAEMVTYWAYDVPGQVPDEDFIEGILADLEAPENFCDILYSGMIGEDGEFLMSAHQGNVNQEAGLFDAWQTHKYFYLAIIDEGDTEALQDEIAFSWSSDTWQMRDRLLSISPYVSKEALMDVADRTDVFPHPVALEIFVANPEVLRDNRFLQYLEEKTDPMPGFMIDVLYESRNTSTFRAVLEGNLTRSEAAYFANQKAILRGELAMEDAEAEVRIRLASWKNPAAEYWLIERLLDEGDATEASNRYQAMPETIRLKGEDEIEWEVYETWLNLRRDLISGGRGWDTLTVAEMDILDGLVDYWHTQAGLNAMEVLNFYYGENYFVPPAFGGEWTPRAKHMKPIEVRDQWLKVYPNPAGVYVNFELKPGQLSPSDTWQLRLFDLTGRLVLHRALSGQVPFHTLDLRMLTNGMYFYELELPGAMVSKGKLDVVK